VPLLRRQWSWPRAGRWRRHLWCSCLGAQDTAAQPGRRRLTSRARRLEERGSTKTGELEGETVAPVEWRFGQAACGLRVQAEAVGSGHFNRLGWYCRHGLGPIRCTTFFQLFKLCSNFEIHNDDHPYVHKCSNMAW
jgi:hypothetical protein